MKVFILCGGFGTRLDHEGTLIAKPMVRIGPDPILMHIIKNYCDQGFNDFVFCLVPSFFLFLVCTTFFKSVRLTFFFPKILSQLSKIFRVFSGLLTEPLDMFPVLSFKQE